MGREIHQAIVIDAKVKATLEDMNDVVGKLNKGLRDGASKIDLTKGVGNSLSKSIEKFREDYDKFSKYIANNKLEFGDSKDALKSGQALLKTFQDIRRVVGNFSELELIDAKKLFPNAFDTRVDELYKKISNFQTVLNSLEVKGLEFKNAREKLGSLQHEGEVLKASLADETQLNINVEDANKKLQAAQDKIQELRNSLKQELKLKVDTTNAEKVAAESALTQKKQEVAVARAKRKVNEQDFGVSSKGVITYKGKTKTEWGSSKASKEQITAAQEAIRLYSQEESQIKTLTSAVDKLTKKASELTKAYSSIETADLAKTAVELGRSSEDFDAITNALKEEKVATEEAAQATEKLKAAQEGNKKIQENIARNTKAISEQEAAVEKLDTQYTQLKDKLDAKGIGEAFASLNIDFSEDMLKNEEAIKKLKDQLKEIDKKALSNLVDELEKMGVASEETEELIKYLKKELLGIDESAKDIARTASEMENLKNQVLQFFSITNTIQLFKRAVTRALNTVKELDATMTEAAVVTEFDIGDMWDKLPTYSVEAQKLGVSINGMYQATTLYYQQGLKTNEAMQLGVETMKMGKIAAMDSTEATKAMTAALRGFNMELNETSAVRVNDVYSQLAAVTAADTNQIATAMEKTASIAASANMEFETTAALLAQIIETTQEAPETAGTALKTIIARFAEVKSLREQGQTSGKDSEGEDIDVNKIQTALRTVGISMEGFFNGTEGLDSILLKLSEKWGTLDFETQRYIATMAAGSRQQSRFIAMMSDYGRTTELVSEAQNSAGASQRQFEKTQESLATSIQRLENAWNEFLMGLANNEVLKFAIDSLTFIVEGINKITDALSGGNGLIKALISLIGVIGALKTGKALLSNTSIGGMIGGLTGNKGAVKETVTETKDDDGSIVRTIVKEPMKQGEQAGQQAGQGFVAGFKRAVEAGREGGGFGDKMKAMFTTGKNENKVDRVKGRFITKKGKEKLAKNQQAVDLQRDAFMESVRQKNGADLDDKEINKISYVYDDIIQKGGNAKQAADGVNQSLKEMGREMGEVGEGAEGVSLGLQGTTLNMGALGGAVMGVGGALGLLASLFENIGLEEWAEPISILAGVFMGLGTVMSLLSSIAPKLGMSFTTAGVQITAAGVTSQLAWWWVFAIIAAVALFTIGIIALFKAGDDKTIEERMQEAAEATENAKQAAEDAKNAYEDLLSAKEGYNELQNQLKELTRGTTEWKQALVESNAQVLKLLDSYPELTKYLTRGDQGQLVISNEGWEALIAEQEYGVRMTGMAVQASRMDETKLKQEQIETDMWSEQQYSGQNIDNYLKDGTISVNWTNGGTFDEETISGAYDIALKYFQENPQIAQAEIADEGALEGEGIYSEVYQQLLDAGYDLGTGYDVLIQEVHEYTQLMAKSQADLARVDAELQGQAEAMLMAGVSTEVMTYEYSEQLIAGMGKIVAASQDNRENEIKGNLNLDKGEEVRGSSELQSFIKERELAGELTGDNTHDLKVIYAELAGYGKNLEAIPDGIAESNEKMAAEISKMLASDEAAKKTETVQKNMAKLDKQTQRLYAAAMSGDVSTLTRKGAEDIGKLNIQSLAVTMGYEDIKDANGNVTKTAAQQLAEARGTTEDELRKELNNMGDIYNQELAKIIKNSTKLGITEEAFDKEYLKEATLQQQKIYAQLMTDALANGATNLQAQFDGIMANLTADQQQQVLDMMGTFDFSQAGSAEEFIEALKMIGINIPTQQVEGFVTELKKLEDDFEKIDFSKIREEIKELLDLADEFGERKESQGLTQEERDELIEYGIAKESDFVWTGQEWLYIEGPMSKLQKAIEDNTKAILEEKKVKVDELVKRGEFVEGLTKGKEITYMSAEGVFNGIPEAKIINKEDFLQGKIEDTSILAQIFDLDAEKMSGAEILEYYKDSLAAYVALGDNRAQQAEYDSQVSRTINLSNHEMMDPKTAYYQNRGVVNNYTKEEVDKLKALADIYDVSQATIDRYTAALKTNNVELINNAAAALKNSIEQKKQEKQYGKTLQSINTLYEEMGHVTAGMDGFTEAVNSYGYALGIDMTIADNWELVAENMELIQKAANGDIDAILALNKLLAQQHGLIIAADGSLDLENSDVNWDDSGFQAFMDEQYKKGAFEWAEVVAEVGKSYLVRGESGGYERVTIGEGQAGQNIKALQAQDRNSIINSQRYSGLSENKGWENPYDKYYNTVQKINAELRKREQLERQYQRLQERGMATAKLLTEERKKQLQSLNDERLMREALLNKREAGIDDIMTKYSDVSKYASYDETYGVQIDWNLINQLEGSNDEKLTSRVEEFISKLEEQEDLINEENDAIEEIKDGVWEIYQQGKDDYFDLENQIKEAVIADRQKEIDKLSEIDNSINETNSKLIESIQTQLDLDRQQRQNEKTEQDIADKQSRLLYLQQDSSGANALEIIQLQEEIDQAQEDYTDTLIDQKISELQRQNDEASQQRQRQIEIMQSQLDYDIKSGGIWKDVKTLMEKGFDEKGIKPGSDLETLLKDASGYTTMSELEKLDWSKDMKTNVANALTWLEIGATQALFGQGATVNLKNERGEDEGKATIDEKGNLVAGDRLYEAGDFEMKTDGTVVTKISQEAARQKKIKKDQEAAKAEQQIDEDTGSKEGTEYRFVIKNGQLIAEKEDGKIATYGSIEDAENAIKNKYKKEVSEIRRIHQGKWNLNEILQDLEEQYNYLWFDGKGGFKTGIFNLVPYDDTKHYRAFKTGGLADFTGPAWLDGTKTKPEYILSAEQTKAFFTLVDVLSSFKNNTSKTAQNNGDNTYDIDINVESISNDYDVEQLAIKIQEMIVNSSRYRSNNML